MLILHRALQFVLNCFVLSEQAKSIKKLQYLQAYIMTVASNMYQYCLHFIGTLAIGAYKLSHTLVIRVFQAFSFCPLHFINFSLTFQLIAIGCQTGTKRCVMQSKRGNDAMKFGYIHHGSSKSSKLCKFWNISQDTQRENERSEMILILCCWLKEQRVNGKGPSKASFQKNSLMSTADMTYHSEKQKYQQKIFPSPKETCLITARIGRCHLLSFKGSWNSDTRNLLVLVKILHLTAVRGKEIKNVRKLIIRKQIRCQL